MSLKETKNKSKVKNLKYMRQNLHKCNEKMLVFINVKTKFNPQEKYSFFNKI